MVGLSNKVMNAKGLSVQLLLSILGSCHNTTPCITHIHIKTGAVRCYEIKGYVHTFRSAWSFCDLTVVGCFSLAVIKKWGEALIIHWSQSRLFKWFDKLKTKKYVWHPYQFTNAHHVTQWWTFSLSKLTATETVILHE